MLFLEKVGAGLLTLIIFVIGINIISPQEEGYGMAIFIAIYAAPVVFIGGILFSFLADYLMERVKKFKYFVMLLLYIVGGVLVNVYHYGALFYDGFGESSLFMMIFGIIMSLIFMHVMLGLRKLLQYLYDKIT
ncbi:MULTISPECIES: hypothetical protein [Bacillus]|uniref:hypothetical protein n=1 Tax=Bacillus TaxID=1386 RepID=UPI000BB9BBDC|nr:MULTISPECIES: hypothetical protein [Bacillus]